jgi:hypothetical protein
LEFYQRLGLDGAQPQALVVALQLLNSLLQLIAGRRQGLLRSNRPSPQPPVALQVASVVFAAPQGQVRRVQSILSQQLPDRPRLAASRGLLDDRALELNAKHTPLGPGLDLRRHNRCLGPLHHRHDSVTFSPCSVNFLG